MSARIARGLRRLVRAGRCAWKRASGQPLHIHVEGRWRIGDEILALPFYDLLSQQFPTARITASVNHPEFLAGRPRVIIDGTRSKFECDRYIFLCEDLRGAPRLESLCRRHGVPFSPVEPRLNLPGPDPRRDDPRRIAYSTGAGWTCKQWPAEHMRELLTKLQAAHPDAEFVELGKECPGVGVGLDLRDQLSLEEAARTLRDCSLYIGPDSGLVHLALAVGTPAVGVYGPVLPAKAFGAREQLLAVISPEPCQGCWTDSRMREPGACPLGHSSASPIDYPCMNTISPDAVFDRIEESGVLDEADR